DEKYTSKRYASGEIAGGSEEEDRVRTWFATYRNAENLDQITLVAECHTEYWRLSVIVGFLGETSIAFPDARTLFKSISDASLDSKESVDTASLRKLLVDEFEKFVFDNALPEKEGLNDAVKKIVEQCFCNFIGSIFWKPINPGDSPDFDIKNNGVWSDEKFDCEDKGLIRNLWPIIDAIQGSSSKKPGFQEYEMTASYFLKGRAIYSSSLGHPITPSSNRTRLVPVVYSLFVCVSDAWQIGRLLDTVHSMGVLRIAALRNIDKISDASKELADIRSSIRDSGSLNIKTLQKQMDELLKKDASWRIERSQRYWKQFLARVDRVRIVRIEGFQPYDVFVNRRIGDTITFIESTGKQLANIRKEIDFRYQMMQTESLEKNINYITSLQKAGELLLLFPLSYYSYMMYEKIYQKISKITGHENKFIELGIIVLAFLSAWGMILYAEKKFHKNEKAAASSGMVIRLKERLERFKTSRHYWHAWVLFAIAAVVLASLIVHGPIAQDQDYHRFADARHLCGISNFWNVVTNLPFLLFSGWGLNVLYRRRTAALPMRTAYATFFVGASAVAFGSAYYHLDPSDASLVWDRLPMTIAFMAFFAALVGRHIRSTLGERALLPLLLIGLLSVVWWRAVGDLRPYLAVQFLPILLIPAMLLMYPTNVRGTRYFWTVLGLYALAKALETYDASVYDALGMSGHALKHMSAALGVACVALAVRAQMPETTP
ncbi:MAG: DUF3422 family protein, partial [Lysobacter sp.]|nr:DUF3422 family protein [Lysobacter sp.]